MHPDQHMNMPAPQPSPQSPTTQVSGAVTRIDGLVADIEQSLEILQARLEPVVFHRPSEAPDMIGSDKPLYAPLAADIHTLADRLAKIRDSLGYTLGSLEV